MKPSDPRKFLKILLAGLVLAPRLVSLSDAFTIGTLVTMIFLSSVHFFKIIRPLFPAGLFRFSVVLGFVSLFQWGLYGSFSIPVFWILSLALLWEWGDFETNHLGLKPLAAETRAGLFWLGALFFGATRHFFGDHFFEHPAGFFFAAAMFLFLLIYAEKPLLPVISKKRKKR